jgi:hypothetical protein
MKPDAPLLKEPPKSLRTALEKYSGAAPEIELRPYEGFPKGMILDYERKFSYVR